MPQGCIIKHSQGFANLTLAEIAPLKTLEWAQCSYAAGWLLDEKQSTAGTAAAIETVPAALRHSYTGGRRPVMAKTIARTMPTTKSIQAMLVAVPAMPVKPSTPAMRPTIRKIRAHESMAFPFSLECRPTVEAGRLTRH